MRKLTLSAAVACGLVALPALAEVEARYKPGGGFTHQTLDGDHKINWGGRLQLRYTYMELDEARHEEDVSEFTAERVRIHAKGHVFRDWKYKFQADFGKGRSGDNLKDAVLTYARVPEAQMSIGQFKVRFDRQQYVSSGKQQFVDRSLAARRFGIGRDVGAIIHGEVGSNEFFEYNVGVYDGEGEGGRNRNDGHMWVARIAFNPNGAMGYSESDIKRTDEHLWQVALAAAHNDDIWDDADKDGHAIPMELTDVERYVASFAYQHMGFYLQGEYYWEDMEVEDDSLDREADGWYFQLGYVFPGSKWEVAARHSEVDPDDELDDDEESETMIGINRYLQGVGHSLKIQGDLAWLDEETPADDDEDFDDWRARLQFQIVF